MPDLPEHDLAVRSRRVVTPRGIEDATVLVRGPRIAAVVNAPSTAGLRGVVDLGEAVVMPGIVDTHVHVNEPGRTEWEGFETATAAAAAGGITTIVDMPLNSVPATTSREALGLKLAASAGKCAVDVGFWAGVVPGNAAELEGLAGAGALGFKCFLAPSGVDEFPHVIESDLRAAMPVVARLGLPLLVHAELPGPIERALARLAGDDPRRYATWLASRPRAAESEAIRLMIRLGDEYRCRVHIVHLSAADALPDLAGARRRGLPITVETCPHYLFFAAEEIGDGDTSLKCAPPIRERENRERLWAALSSGEIDLIVSDHSPSPPALKCTDTGDFMSAWGGIASLEVSLAATWTAARARGLTPADLARWMSERPAGLAGLDARKGRIAPGFDADLVAWDPDAEWTVEPSKLHQRHPVTPYAGRRLLGRVRQTWVRGTCVYESGEVARVRHGEPLQGVASLDRSDR